MYQRERVCIVHLINHLQFVFFFSKKKNIGKYRIKIYQDKEICENRLFVSFAVPSATRLVIRLAGYVFHVTRNVTLRNVNNIF